MQPTMTNHTSQVVSKLPICHFCLEESAYDAKTVFGYRASMCSRDFKKVGVESEALRLVTIEPTSSHALKHRQFTFGIGQFAAPSLA